MASNREILDSIYKRWNRNDGDLALDLFAEDAEIRQSRALLDTAVTFQGPQGLVQSAHELAEAFSRIDWHAEAWVEEGDWLIARFKFVGAGRASGIAQEVIAAHAWKLRDGKVTHFHVYPSVSAAIRALQADAAESR